MIFKPTFFFITFISLMGVSCQDALINVEVLESKSQSSDAVPVTISDDERTKEHPVFAGTYTIKVASKSSGSVVCDGEFDGVLWSNQLFVPEGQMSCPLGQKKSLRETFPSDTAKGMEEFDAFGMVVRRVARPGFRLNPNPTVGLALVQNHEEFKDFALAEEITLDFVEDGKEKSVTGHFGFLVEKINDSMTIQSGDVYPKVISYKSVTDGFDDAPRKEAGIETQRQTWVNTKPIALLKIQIQSTIKDQMPGLAGNIGELLYGPIEITIQLIKPRPLVDSDYDRL